jgi:hypothetical protein
MTTLYGPSSRLIWSLSSSGLGTTISGSGNSGAWANTGVTLNALSAVDLRDTADVILMVTVGAVVGTPSLTVVLNIFDDVGNLYATGITTAALTAAGSSLVSGGLHGLTGMQLVLPQWGQVAWTQTGSEASVTGTEIAVYAR